MRKRFYLAPLALVTLSPLALAAACGKADFAHDAKQRIVRSGINASYIPKEFDRDKSNGYGAWQARHEDSLASLLIRKKTYNKPELVREFDQKTNKIVTKIKQPSFWKYKLEHAAKIILIVDGQPKEYDSDDAQLLQKPDADGYYHEAVIKGESTNAKSINSKQFADDLAKATKLQIEVRKGTKWVDAQGNVTKYDVVPEDWYISWMRTQLLGKAQRKNAAKDTSVDTEALDTALREIASKNSSYYGKDYRYPNAYLFGLYGVEIKDLNDKSKFLEGDKITFNKIQSQEKAFFELLLENLTSSQEFSAAPSQYIAEVSKQKQIPALESYSEKQLSSESFEKIKNIPTDNILSQAGVYWYGFNSKNLLYASPFIYKGYNRDTQEETYEKNPHYVDQEWVKDPTTIEKQVLRYFGAEAKVDQLKEVLYDDYLKGRIARLAWTMVPDKQKTSIIQNPQKYGVQYNQSLNKSSLQLEQVFDLTPTVALPNEFSEGVKFDTNNKDHLKTIVDQLTYNDNFAKLLYGKTKEDIVKDAVKGADTQHFYTGKGYVFRSLLSRAINFQHVASFITEGKSKMYVAAMAPDAKIGGSDQTTTATKKSMRDAYEDINTTTFVKSDLTKSTAKTPEDYRKIVTTSGSELEKLKSPHFAEIKAEIKKLLDDAGITEGQKVEWQLTFRWVNWTPAKMQTIYEQLPLLFKELDPRLEFKAVKYDKAQVGLFWAQHLQGRSPFTIGGWGYDTDSAGSGFDGIINLTQSGPVLAILSQGTDTNKEAFKKAFPKLFALSEAFNKFIKDELDKKSFTLTVDHEKWHELSFGDLDKLAHHLREYKLEGGKLVPNTQIKETDADFGTITSRFFNTHLREKTNDEIIELTKEFSDYFGTLIDTKKLTSLDRFSESLVNPNFVFPFVGADQDWIMDAHVIVKK